jgi:hypothetical protein
MLAETIFYCHKISGAVVCACSLSASSIKTADLPANRGRKVKPKQKSLKLYPGILIGRLGVSKEFNGQGVGSQFMDIIKNFCVINFSSYARFLLVDTLQQIESHLLMRHYDGFLKSGRIIGRSSGGY